jgi:hypothetical protein
MDNGCDDDEDYMVDTIDGETAASYIYTWYEPRFHAIKVGCGSDAEGRMVDYASTYSFEYSKLHQIALPALLNIRHIETKCHAALASHGLPTIPPTRELFALGTKLSYEQAVAVCEAVINEALVDAAVFFRNKRSHKVETTYQQRLASERAAKLAEQERQREAERQKEREAEYQKEAAALAEHNERFKKEQLMWNDFMAVREEGHEFLAQTAITGGLALVVVGPFWGLSRWSDKRAFAKKYGVTYDEMKERWSNMAPWLRKSLKKWFKWRHAPNKYPCTAEERQLLFTRLTDRNEAEK